MTVAVSTLILLPLASEGSRAAVGANAVSSSAVPLGDLERAAREHCPDARLRARVLQVCRASLAAQDGGGDDGQRSGNFARRRRHIETAPRLPPDPPRRHASGARRLRANRLRYQAWAYQYDWRSWMPAKWQRIGACETGYGKRPGDFHWNSGTYQGFVGFFYGTWDAFKPSGFPAEAYQATPRQQMVVAERVRAAVGYGAWGCGGVDRRADEAAEPLRRRSRMRSLWLDRGTGPNPAKINQYSIACVYEDIRDATKASVAANAKLCGVSGVYACWNWPEVPTTGPDSRTG